jgi:hypothetical protein
VSWDCRGEGGKKEKRGGRRTEEKREKSGVRRRGIREKWGEEGGEKRKGRWRDEREGKEDRGGKIQRRREERKEQDLATYHLKHPSNHIAPSDRHWITAKTLTWFVYTVVKMVEWVLSFAEERGAEVVRSELHRYSS